MESPVPPCGRGVYHKVAAPSFFIIMYIVQLCEEEWAILYMLGCWAIALPCTKQIVHDTSLPVGSKWLPGDTSGALMSFHYMYGP